jgi:hypothetical protein
MMKLKFRSLRPHRSRLLLASMALALVAMTAGAWGSLWRTAVAASSSGGYIAIRAAVAKKGSQVFYGGPATIATVSL